MVVLLTGIVSSFTERLSEPSARAERDRSRSIFGYGSHMLDRRKQGNDQLNAVCDLDNSSYLYDRLMLEMLVGFQVNARMYEGRVGLLIVLK